MIENIVIFGAGEIAELAHFYFKNDSSYEVVAFTADDKFIKKDTFNNLPLIPLSEIEKKYSPNQYKAHVALSYKKLNTIRAEKYFTMKNKGYELVSYVCSKSLFWSDLQIGDNCFILENQTIQPYVTIGNNVMIWSGNHLGHGCKINDHAYLSSHICISGHTTIGEYTFVGVNSTFKDFINIGNRVFVAMDASVTQDIPSDAVILGAQGTILGKEQELAKKIKKKYFKF